MASVVPVNAVEPFASRMVTVAPAAAPPVGYLTFTWTVHQADHISEGPALTILDGVKEQLTRTAWPSLRDVTSVAVLESKVQFSNLTSTPST